MRLLNIVIFLSFSTISYTQSLSIEYHGGVNFSYAHLINSNIKTENFKTPIHHPFFYYGISAHLETKSKLSYSLGIDIAQLHTVGKAKIVNPNIVNNFLRPRIFDGVGINHFLLPISIHYKLLTKEKITLMPYIGITPAIYQKGAQNNNIGGIENNTYRFLTYGKTFLNNKNIYTHYGFYFRYRWLDKWSLISKVFHNNGWIPAETRRYSLWLKESNEMYEYEVENKGSYFAVTIGVNFEF